MTRDNFGAFYDVGTNLNALISHYVRNLCLQA